MESKTSDSSVGNTKRNPLRGWLLLALFFAPLLGGLFNLFGLGIQSDEYYVSIAKTWAGRENVPLTLERLTLLVRELKLNDTLSLFLTPLYFLPFLIFGSKLVLGLDHRLWSWQNRRKGRHPLIACLPFLLAIATLQNAMKSFFNPLGARSGMGDLVWFVILLAVSVWLYVGRKRPENLDDIAAGEEA